MTCTGVGLAAVFKWNINRADPVMSHVRRERMRPREMELTPEHARFIQTLDSRLASEPLNAADVAEICEHEFLRDPARIIALNDEIRQFEAHWTTDDVEPRLWPDDYMIIGDSGCGDYYCVSRSGAFAGIVAYEHEMAAFTSFAANFDEYYELMMRDFRKRVARY